MELCRVESGLHMISGKWKTLILLQLLINGTQRFNELKRNLPGITQKMLTNQLRELEEDDLIERKIYPQIPPKVEYSISEYGRTLEPILDAMHEWASNHESHKVEKQRTQISTSG